MSVDQGCISANIKSTVTLVTSSEISSFCLSVDIKFTSFALNSIKIYSFE